MNLLYANPVTLIYHYLLLLLYGTPLEELHHKFSQQQKAGNPDFAGNSVGTNGITSGCMRDAKEYDFVIVGGGSAGAVVASRLTEANYTVLLIEAGGYPTPLTAVPALAPANKNHPDIDWKDETEPQLGACLALNNNATIYNHGKCLGGSSNLNFMVVMRGGPSDYNRWADEAGDPSWGYDSVLPYFKKLENYHGHFPKGEFHGTGGPLDISGQDYAPLQKEWLAAGTELGFSIKDSNSELAESFFPLDTTNNKGIRASTHLAYLYPKLLRPNLCIKMYAHATKIALDESNSATGVHYYSHIDRRTEFVKATKEVIVSSGTINSPHLLLLSGIGPEAQLRRHGIPVRANLPVGESLQDHHMVWVGPFAVDDMKGYNAERDLNLDTLSQYIQNGTGPFSTGGSPAGAVLHSTLATPGHPDIYLMPLSMGISERTADGLTSSFGFKKGILRQYFKTYYGRDAFFVLTVLAHPKSWGSVKLRTKNPFGRPEIDPKYFSHPDDIKVVLEGIGWARKVVETEAFKSVGAKLITSLFPGCEYLGNTSTDAYWECYARHWTSTVWHYTSTNRMGRAEKDPMAVVDSQLKVIGTKNLRVIDASIMPSVTTANTNIPTIMIGEKGVEMIKQFWANI